MINLNHMMEEESDSLSFPHVFLLIYLFGVIWCLFDIYLMFCIQLHFRLVGGFLTLSPDYGFVLEDEEGICGYALGTMDVKPFVKKCSVSWIPSMQEKYTKPDGDKELSFC